MTQLKLNLLGGFEACYGGSSEPLAFPRKKAAALLAVLASPCGRKRSREDIADLLWGFTGEASARNSLRQTLFAIRRILPNFPGLKITPDSLLLGPEHVASDVAAFEAAAAKETLPALQRAAALYVGDFLQGFSLREDTFERWRAGETARLRDIALSVFERLLAEYMALGRHTETVQIANRSLAIDPLHEGAHQTLIRVYAAEGRTGLAHQQFQACRDLLARELGVEPSEETENAYAALSGLQTRPTAPPDRAIAAPASISGFRNAPIVAVLPIASLDATSLAFADALTAQLIAVLAVALPLTIVDHRSISAAAAQQTSTRKAAAALDARYAVEGSVRSWGGQWRVDVSLIDVNTGRHLCTGSYQQANADLFQLADSFALQIATKVAHQVDLTERQRAMVGNASSLDAWESFQRGRSLLNRCSVERIRPARKAFEHAVELEPNNARAVAGLAFCLLQAGIFLVCDNREDAYAESLELGRRAHALDRTDWYVNWMLGKAYQRNERFDLARESLQRALKGNPENFAIRTDVGNLLSFMDMPDKGIPILAHSLKFTESSMTMIARSHLQARNYKAARVWAERENRAIPNHPWAYIVLASALGHLDRPAEAWAALQECERRHPGRVNDEFMVRPTQYKNPHDHDHILDGVRKAGWSP